ncbi:MAG: SCO6880 family protein, partial [Acidimicrobiales bacterium]
AYVLACLLGRRRWLARLDGFDPAGQVTAAFPPGLAGQVILAVDSIEAGFGRAGSIAVVHDTKTGRLSASLRVAAGAFALAEDYEQARLVAVWGDAQAAFCTEASPVVAIRWSEWAAPAAMEEQLAWLAEQGAGSDDAGIDSYRRFLEAAGPMAARHEVLVSLVADAKRIRAGGRRRARQAVSTEVLVRELRSFARRLESGGMAVAPLSPGELAHALRVRMDPTAAPALDRRGRTLGATAGIVSPPNAGPLAAEVSWSHWRVEGSFHRGFLVTEWPRVDVRPAWMAELLLFGGAVRTISVVAEPVPLRQSRRAIERQATKLASDAEQRERCGFRVSAAHRRAESAVAEREVELVAGYAELRFTGVVVVSAADLEELDEACQAMAEVAGRVGVELRALHARHDLAVGACLPLARALAPERST